MSTDELEFDVLATTRIRRATAKRLRASVATKPSVTLHRTFDAAGLFGRADYLRAHAKGNVRPTLTSVLAVVLARVLEQDPLMNSCLLEGDQMCRYKEVHLAVAIATDQGLVAPVMRPADLVDDVGAALALAGLSNAARGGGLKPEQLAPFTFTLTNLGSLGVEYFTPIVNPPNVGILGVGRSGSALKLPVSLTFDHAAVDGVDGARFLQSLANEIDRVEVQPKYATGEA